MTNQEVINKLHVMKNLIEWDMPLDYQEVVDLAVEALEKQIPMPTRITTSTKRCGRCGRQLSGINNIHPKRNYCTGCGQKILWED